MAGCAHKLAADLSGCLLGAIEKRGHAALAVSGGRTPEHIFPLLCKADLMWDRVRVTLTDERWVAPDNPDSNEGLACRLLMQGPAAKARFIGMKTDHAEPCDGQADVEQALAAVGWPLDAVFLGMGEDGHIASLFPDLDNWQDAPGRALAVAGSLERQPRMSLTPRALLDSRHIFLVISGSKKRATYEAALEPGPIGALPIRLILHQNQIPVTVYAVD